MNITYKSIHLVIILLICTAGFEVNAQDTIPINLETVLELGGANNLTIQEYKQRQNLAAANLTKAKEWWLPDVYAGVQTHQLWGATMNGNGRFFLDVNRNSLWTGLGLDAHWKFADGIYESKVANLEAKAAQYRTQAEKNQALLEIISAYYDFFAAQFYYQSYYQLIQQADTISNQLAIKVDAGLMYNSELLLSKSNTSHLKIQMLNAKAEYERKSATLIKLLNLDPNLSLISSDSLLTPLNISGVSTEIRFDSIYQKRPEYRMSALKLKAIQTKKKTVTTGLLIPELRMQTYGSYFGSLNGELTPMDPVQYPQTNQLYPTGAINFSLKWRIPLGRLTYGGDVKQYNTHILLQQTKLKQVKAEINEDIIASQKSLEIANEQMEIAYEGNKLAEEALKQSIQRQELGTVRPFEILQAQEVFIKVRLDYLKAVSDFNKAQYALKVALGEKL